MATKKTTRSRSKISATKQYGAKKRTNSYGPFFALMSFSFGRVGLVFFVVLAIIGLNFLLSFNHFDRFFMLLGSQLIVAALVSWVRFIYTHRQSNTK